MNKKMYNRMLDKIHELNESVLSTPILIKKLLPKEQQPSYNRLLKEYSDTNNKLYEIIADTSGIFASYKESEDWRENGMLGIHDYSCSINDNLPNIKEDELNLYMVERKEDGKQYEIVFYREYIGEVLLGLRPVITNGTI